MENFTKLNETHSLTELSLNELQDVSGGTASGDDSKAQMVGLGIAQALAFSVAGVFGYAYVTYNYFKS